MLESDPIEALASDFQIGKSIDRGMYVQIYKSPGHPHSFCTHLYLHYIPQILRTPDSMSISSNSVRRTGAIAKKGSLSDEAQGVLSVIRGLINSRKRITTLKDVESEYKDLEGQSIPFAKCGFPSLMDLMRSSGDFHISKNGDEVYVDSS